MNSTNENLIASGSEYNMITNPLSEETLSQENSQNVYEEDTCDLEVNKDPTRENDKTRSAIWKYFKYDKEKNNSICKVTNQCKLIAGKYPTNLKQHLKRHHDNEYLIFLKLAEEEKNVDKNKAAKQLTIEKFLNKQEKYKITNPKQKEFNQKVAWFIGANFVPFDLVENEDFEDLFFVADPKLSMPSRSNLDLLIDQQYIKIKTELRKILKNAEKINLVVDGWTKKGFSSSYLGVVCCFYNMNKKRRENYVLAVRYFRKLNHTKEAIKDLFDEVMQEYEIAESKILKIITDNAKNMKSAFDSDKSIALEEAVTLSSLSNKKNHNEDPELDFLAQVFDSDDDDDDSSVIECEPLSLNQPKRISCMIHSLLLCLKDFKQFANVNAIIDNVKRIINVFAHSSVGTQMLQNIIGKKLVAFSNTRWNIIYLVMKRMIQLKIGINECLVRLHQDELRTSEWNQIEDFCKFLAVQSVH